MNPLTKAHRGVLRKSSTKGALTIALVGVLFFSEVITIIPVQAVKRGGRSIAKKTVEGDFFQDRLLERQEKIKQEDEEIMLIIKLFLDVID